MRKDRRHYGGLLSTGAAARRAMVDDLEGLRGAIVQCRTDAGLPAPPKMSLIYLASLKMQAEESLKGTEVPAESHRADGGRHAINTPFPSGESVEELSPLFHP